MAASSDHYQAHIDGLRAVAVSSVLLYHLSPDLLPGGFVGVDIFFVISGYLITSIILREIERGEFSMLRFLERRARRLLPALAVVLTATTVAAWALLLPEDLVSYGQSLTATGLFTSNFHFWSRSGYFDGAAQLKPLLHTWSLTVEEQFYLVWPLLLVGSVWVLRRLRGAETVRPHLLALVLGLTGLSLVSAEIVVRTAPTSAFFLMPYRAWELGIGAALALIGAPGLARIPPGIRPFLSAAGLCALAAGLLLLSQDSAVPGVAALVPTLGAAAIIAFGGAGWPGRLLSSPPMVGIGLISYAAYLWHWPILAFFHGQAGRGVQGWEIVAVAGMVIVLATLTTWCIERPLRARPSTGPWRQLATAAVVLVAMVGVGRAMWFDKGWISRLDPSARAIYEASISRNPLRPRCDGFERAFSDDGFCNFGKAKPAKAPFDLVVLGDSNADQWVPMLAEYTREKGWSARQVTNSTCAPVLGVNRRNVAGNLNHQCESYQDAVVEFLKRNPGLREVVLAGVWTSFMDMSIEANRIRFDADVTAFADRFGARGSFAWHMAATISLVRRTGADVLLIAPIVSLPKFTPACVVKAISAGRSAAECGVDRTEAEESIAAPTRVLERLAAEIPGVRLARPIDVLCDNSHCSPVRDDVLLYRDFGHLNAVGSVVLGHRLGLIRSIPNQILGAAGGGV